MKSCIRTSTFSLSNVLLCSIFLRVGLILYSEWHDARSVVKYTDVDYRVFSDAARFVLHPGPRDANRAQGPLKIFFGHAVDIGDPYTRRTYRYTPLLAILLTPNDWLHPSFGKYLFAACDIINGLLIYRILLFHILPLANRRVKKSIVQSNDVAERAHSRWLATVYTASYLLNPMIFSISTRGSSESVLAFFVLLTLYASLKERWTWAAILLGVSTHWKIYPFIYGTGCLGVISNLDVAKFPRNYVQTLINKKTVCFLLVSLATFAFLGSVCYALWGYPFLYESYLYHVHRLDHRHNFSPFFYLTYLTYPSLDSKPTAISSWSEILRSPLTNFIPQMGLSLGTGFLFGRDKEDLPFTWFVQTFIFVMFNKVCTSQYFLWYLVLFPLILPNLSLSGRQALIYGAIWIGPQALWLGEAYQLEFLGRDVFLGVWIRGLLHMLGNCAVLVGVMDAYKSRPTIRLKAFQS